MTGSGRVELTITEPIHDTVVRIGTPVSLRGVGPAPEPGGGLHYRWWSSLPTSPAPTLPDPPGVDDFPIAKALVAETRLSIGSHVLTLSAKDRPGDDEAALEQVRHVGMTGGAPPGAEAPCVVHVVGATLLLPPGGIVSRSVGVAAVAPPIWAEATYQKVNALVYRWTFRPQPAGRHPDVVVDPPAPQEQPTQPWPAEPPRCGLGAAAGAARRRLHRDPRRSGAGRHGRGPGIRGGVRVNGRQPATDLRLATTFDGELDLVANGRGDLAVVTGTDDVVQALMLRLLVRESELAGLGWPDFGSRVHELIGEPDVTRTRLRLAAYVREALARDPRVAEVTSVEITTDQVEARATAQVLLSDDATVAVSIAVALGA